MTAPVQGNPAIETAAFSAGLGSALRRAGIGIPPDKTVHLARALALVPPSSRSRLYWTCRAVLLSRAEQVPVFDSVFSALFDGMLDPADTRGEQNAPPPVGSEPRARTAQETATALSGTEMASRLHPVLPGTGDSSGQDTDAVLLTASAEESLHAKNFAGLTRDELADISALVRRIVLATPRRLTRRTRRSPHGGTLDLRRTTRAGLRSGGTACRLVRTERTTAARRLVLLCDVSASMSAHTQVFLSLIQGAVGSSNAEAFVFSTGISRLTRQLGGRSADRALTAAAGSTAHWDSGTLLARSLKTFLDDHGRRGMARGAVVVIFSDGWTQDEPDDVSAQMARLRRLAHRIVWVNPRKAAPGFEPSAGGMAAALPFCDAFTSGHSYDSLTELPLTLAGTHRHQPRRTGLAHGH